MIFVIRSWVPRRNPPAQAEPTRKEEAGSHEPASLIPTDALLFVAVRPRLRAAPAGSDLAPACGRAADTAEARKPVLATRGGNPYLLLPPLSSQAIR